MDFAYGGSFTESSPEAYERLILDVLLGDPPLFPQHAGGRAVLEDPRPDPRALGQAGRRGQVQGRAVRVRQVGPESAHAMLARDGRVWRRP